MINRALENIEHHFIFVGIQEHFDKSMILLFNQLKLSLKHYKSLNKATSNPEIDEELIREIEKLNQIDLELYHIMKNRFFEKYAGIKHKTGKKILLQSKNILNALYAKVK